MKSLKSVLFVVMLSASLSMPAFANDAPVATPLPQFTAADTHMLFEQDAQPMQLAALSQQEMMETEGALYVHFVRFGWGALGGGVNYTVSHYGTDDWRWSNLGRSIGYGGVGGLIGWNSASAATIGAGTSAALHRWGW